MISKNTPLGFIMPVAGTKKPKKKIIETEPLSPVKFISLLFEACEKYDETFGESKALIMLKTLF